MKLLKKLFIPIIILVILIVLCIVLFSLNDKPNDTNPSASLYWLSTDINTISNLKLYRKYDSDMTFIPKSIDNSELTWQILSDDVEVDMTDLVQYMITDSVYSFSNFVAEGTIDVDNIVLSDYGLENPDYKIEISRNDGTVTTILIGYPTYEGSQCYFCEQGDNHVYLVSSQIRSLCSNGLSSFRNLNQVNIEYSEVNSISYLRTNEDLSIIIVPDSSQGINSYRITSPFISDVSGSFSNMINSLLNLRVDSYIDIEESDIELYGLDNPAYIFEIVKTDGNKVVYSFSSCINGFYYGFCSESSEYFAIDDNILMYLESPLISVISPYLNYCEPSEIQKITCSYGENDFVYEIDSTVPLSDDTSVYSIDGRNPRIFSSSGACYGEILFNSISNIQIGGIELDVDISPVNPVFEINYVYKDYRVIDISFIQRDNYSYFAFINGEYTGYYVYSDEFLKNGGTYLDNYGVWAAYELFNTAVSNSINGVYDVPL